MATAARLLRPPAGGFGWLKKAAVLIGVTAAGGLTAGAWLGARPDDPPAVTATAPVPPAPPAPVESVPDRNLRVFRAEILPLELEILKELLVGGGEVTLESVEAFDSRIDCVFLLKHRVEREGRVSRLRFLHAAEASRVWVFLDLDGDRRYRSIDLSKPIILWRNPFTGTEWVVGSPPLAKAVRLFGRIPRDVQAATEAADFRQQLRAALRTHEGKWYRQGDPARMCQVLNHGEEPVLLQDDGRELKGCWRFRLTPEGHISMPYAHANETAEFSPDGRRLTFAGGEWWSREPVPDPAK
jgi:hypothetical protein